MRPRDCKTKIFLDSGNPAETKHVVELLGFLDGQTTNPTLVSKHPEAQLRYQKGKKLTQVEISSFYRKIVEEISRFIPQGSISIEVYADQNTTAIEMLSQARDMFSWIPNAQIKFPTNSEGLKAAEQAIKEGVRVNMTLCFSQDQAAAVYSATKGAKRGDVFVSPFIGRLDDIGQNGLDLIKNILQMYKNGDGHVEVLAASIRSMNHLLTSFSLGADIVTLPLKVLEEWSEKGMPLLPQASKTDKTNAFEAIPYQEINLHKNWRDYAIHHELTDKGIKNFSQDWDALIKF